MPPSSQRLLLSLGLSTAMACGQKTTTQDAPPAPETPASSHLVERVDPAVAEARARLLASRVTDTDFARSVLYTWTTPAQVAELMAEREATNVRFLTRRTMLNGEPGLFARALNHLQAESPGDPVERRALALLTNESFGARRFAWPTPWATRRGLGGTDYGNQLVRVELSPAAIIARLVVRSRGFTLRAEPIRFFDLEQREVSLEDVLAAPGRLAAVYHVHIQEDRGVALREYVLVNESRITAVMLGTEAMRATLEQDVALARAAKALLGGRVVALAGDGVIALQEEAFARPSEDLPTAFRASLAFSVPSYLPDTDTMHMLAFDLLSSLDAFPTRAVVLQPRQAFSFGQSPSEVTRDRRAWRYLET